ncbi:MAG: hypothetical protein ACRCXE_01235, partial [Metamycoplasmataceae bacterium]
AKNVNSNCDEAKIYWYISEFKDYYEQKLEEYIVYQGNHPDLKNKNYNLKSIQWMLEKINPADYGVVAVVKESEVKGTLLEYRNVSGKELS